MRKLLSASALMLFISYSAQSQKLVLLPQVGVQTFKSDVKSTSPFLSYQPNSNLTPTLGARLMYISKKGHGPYIAFRSGAMSIKYSDSNSLRITGVSTLRFEAGYQWTTKPIYFKRLWDNKLTLQDFEKLKNKGLAVQLQPSFGITNTQIPGRSYYSFLQSLNPGINAGLGLAFSKNSKQLFTFSFNYNKGFTDFYGNQVKSGNHSSSIVTKGSGFSFSAGIPINIWKKKK